MFHILIFINCIFCVVMVIYSECFYEKRKNMNQYEVIEVEYGSTQYEETILLRDKVMRQPLGLSIKNEDLSYEQRATTLVVYDSDTLLGTGIYEMIDESTMRVNFLCVDFNLQKKGIGRTLLEEIEKRAKQQGIKKITLNARLTALDFYKKLGFNEYGDIFLMKAAPIEHICMEKIL